MGAIYDILAKPLAKAALRSWLNDDNVRGRASDDILTSLVDRAGSVLGRNRLHRQVDDVADQLTFRLEPLFEREFRSVPTAEQRLMAEAVAAATDSITTGVRRPSASEMARAPYVSTAIQQDPDFVAAVRDCSSSGVEYGKRLAAECAEILSAATRSRPETAVLMLQEVADGQSAVHQTMERILGGLPQVSLETLSITDRTRFQTAYERAAIATFDELRLFGAKVKTSSYPLTLAYVDIYADAKDTDVSERAVTSSTIEDVLTSTSRLLLIGGAGSGKTTVLQWLAVQAARSGFSGIDEELNGRTPFMVRLRAHSDGTPFPTVRDLHREVVGHLVMEPPDDWAHRVLGEGRGLLLIDGIDELPREHLPGLRRWLMAIASDYPATIIVATSRPAAVDEDPLLRRQFSTSAAVRPLTRPQVMALSKYWHIAVVSNEMDLVQAKSSSIPEEQYLRREAIDAADRFAASVSALLDSNPTLSRLVTTPLMCALMCAIHHESPERRYRTAGELLEQAIEMFLWRRDQERGVTKASEPHELQDLRGVMSKLALWMLRGGHTEVSTARLEAWMDVEFRRSLQGVGDPGSADLANAAIARSGLLRKVGFDSVDFVHKLFQEYLAAEELIENDASEEALAKENEPSWWNVIIFMIASQRRKERERTIEALVPSDGNVRENGLLLAARGLAESFPRDAQLVKRVSEPLQALLPPTSVAESERFLPLADLILPLLASADLDRLRSGRRFVRPLLTAVGDDEALDVLNLLYPDISSAQETAELMESWDFFDPNKFASKFAGRKMPKVVECHTIGQYVAVHEAAPDVVCRVGLDSLEDLADIPRRTRLVELNIRDASRLQTIEDAPDFRALKSIVLRNARRLRKGVGAAPAGLVRLAVYGMRSNAGFPVLTFAEKLRSLAVGGPVEISLAGDQLTRLNYVIVADGAHLTGLSIDQSPDLRVICAVSGSIDLRELSDLPCVKVLLLDASMVRDDLEDLSLPDSLEHFFFRCSPGLAGFVIELAERYPAVQFHICLDYQGEYDEESREAMLADQANVCGVEIDAAVRLFTSQVVEGWPPTAALNLRPLRSLKDEAFGDVPSPEHRVETAEW